MDNRNNINNSRDFSSFIHFFDLTGNQNSNEEQTPPNSTRGSLERFLQALIPRMNQTDSSPPSTNSRFRVIDVSEAGPNLSDMFDRVFSTNSSHSTHTSLDPSGNNFELQDLFGFDPNILLSSMVNDEPPEPQAPSTPQEIVKQLKELLIDHLDPKFFQNLLDSCEQENGKLPKSNLLQRHLLEKEIETINYISQIQDFNTAIPIDDLEVALHEISQLARHLPLLLEMKMKAELVFGKDLEERLIELQELTENTGENEALHEFLLKSLYKLGSEKTAYSPQVTINCSTLKEEIERNPMNTFEDVFALTQSTSKCIQTTSKHLYDFKNTITELSTEVDQFNSAYCYIKSLRNDEDIAKFLLSERLKTINIFLAILTQLKSTSLSIKLLLKLYMGKEVLFKKDNHQFKTKLLALTLCKYKDELDSEDRKLVLKYLNYISIKNPNHSNSARTVEFLKLVKKQLGSDDLGQIAFTKKELSEYALAKAVMSYNFREELLSYEDLMSIAPYMTILPSINFSKATYSNLSKEQLFNFLSQFKYTNNIILSNYPLSKLPDFKFCLNLQISNSPRLKQLPILPCCNNITLIKSGVRSLEGTYANLNRLVLNENSKLHTIDITPSRLKVMKLRDNAQLKEVIINHPDKLQLVHVLGSPRLQNLTPRHYMPNIKEYLCFDAPNIEDPSKNLLHSPRGKLNICEDMIKDDPESVLQSIYKYSVSYGGLSPFPKVCFVNRGQRSKTVDEGGPTNQLFAQLIQNLIKQKDLSKLVFKEHNSAILPAQLDTVEGRPLRILGQLLGIAGRDHHPIGSAFDTSLYQIIKLFRKKSLLTRTIDSTKTINRTFPMLTTILYPEFKEICEMILCAREKHKDLDLESEPQLLPDFLNEKTLYSCGQLLMEFREKLPKNFLSKDFDEDNISDILSLYLRNPKEFRKQCLTSLSTKLLDKDENIFELYKGLILVAQSAAQILYSNENDRKIWKKKSTADLQLSIEGSIDLYRIIESFKWSGILANTEDEMVTYRRDRAYEYLVSWLNTCSESQRQAFLGATTGSLSLDSSSRITLQLNSEPSRYPSSTTCKKILYLPSSSEKQDFVEKMTFYIDQYKAKSEFHLV